ncbi:TPA: DUF4760 domain-containing protein [Neisseria meningitidis]
MTDNLIQIATPILTVIGVFVAAYGIMRNTENAKKRATINMIMAERNNAALQEAITIVNGLAKTDGCILATYTSDTPDKKKDREAILTVLNQREFVCAGVLGGALHEKMYKDFEYSMLLRDWDNLSSFIFEIRRIRSAPTAFQEFEAVARKWKKKPLKTK